MQNVTLVEFLGLALKSLAIKTPDEKNRNECWLTEDPKTLHVSMMNLATKYSMTLTPLKRMHFDTDGAFPYSIELSKALDLLQQAGMIKRQNPNYDRFAPIWRKDSEQLLKEKQEEFLESDPERSAFEEFLAGLEQLRA